MGQIIKLYEDDIAEIVDEIIKNNTDFSEWCQEDENFREELENIFLDQDDGEKEKNNQKYENKHFIPGMRKAGLYPRNTDTHISAKRIVIDFIKIIFEQAMWGCIKVCYNKATGSTTGNMITPNEARVIINKIKDTIKENVIKLEKETFCFYLQMITHFMEHEIVSLDDIVNWLPDEDKPCSFPIATVGCPFCKNEQCTLKSKPNYRDIVKGTLDSMVKKGILIPISKQNNSYKINY